MIHVERLLLASLLTVIVFIAVTLISLGLDLLYGSRIGALMTTGVITGALFACCWVVARIIIR